MISLFFIGIRWNTANELAINTDGNTHEVRMKSPKT